MRFKKLIFVIGFVFLLNTSCQNENQAPENLISPDIMSLLIADVKIIDAAYQAGIPPISNFDSTDSLIISDSAEYKSALQKKIQQYKDKIESVPNVVKDTLQNEDIEMLPEEYVPTEETDLPDIYLGHTGADYDFVFKKHGVNRKQFESSLTYYAQYPDVFFAICEKALEIMSEKQLILTEKRRKEDKESENEETEND